MQRAESSTPEKLHRQSIRLKAASLARSELNRPILVSIVVWICGQGSRQSA